MVDGIKLNPVAVTVIFGSTFAKDGQINAQIQKRMTKASASFASLR